MVLSLIGCSQKFRDVGETVDNAFFGEDDVHFSKKYLQDMPYASIYTRINGEQQIHMVLAFADEVPDSRYSQLIWISADRRVLVTKQGRIVKTIAMPDNNLIELEAAPPAFDSSVPVTTWIARYDWQPGYRFGYKATVTRRFIENIEVVTPIKAYQTEYFIESVRFNNLGSEIENHYWVDEHGRVIKSLQQLGPKMDSIELLLIKDFG